MSTDHASHLAKGRRADSARRRQRVLRTARQPGLPAGRPHQQPATLRPAGRPGKQLENKLSQLLGQQAWRESGLGAPDDVEQLKLRITTLEQQVVELRMQLEERTEELQAARAANRDLMTRLNR
uniref:Uncharacterized protein n=1 Tax=uncultured bacterium esnapd26 TaxID=1366607 RepID=S5TNG7_9BACT|nr:hypothetical protein [uncultured bacterium esnapd26]